MTDKIILLPYGKAARSQPGAEKTVLADGCGHAAKSEGGATVEDGATNGVDHGDASPGDALTAAAATAVALPVAVPGGSPSYSLKVGQFAIASGEMVMAKTNKDGDQTHVRLCNFFAIITQDKRIDTGSGELRRVFTVKVELPSRHQVIEVQASDFNSLDWVSPQLGANAVVYPDTAKWLPAAIRTLSAALKPVPEQTAVGHVGYSEPIGAKSYYVTGGAILARTGQDVSAIVTDLPTPVAAYALPPAPAPQSIEMKAALASSAAVLDLGPLAVTLPLWLQTYRAALPLPPPDYVVWLEGKTGTFKSSLAGVLQSHFGREWSSTKLPDTWASAKTAIEGVMHGAKNQLCVIDDSKSDGTHQQQRALEAVSGSLVRGVGNRTARGRSTADVKERPIREPRGAALVTGEGPPIGQSVVARCLVVNMDGGSIDTERLTEAQRDGQSGVLAAAMAAFIQWVLDTGVLIVATEYQAAFLKRREEARQALTNAPGTHARTPEAVAGLMATADTVLRFYEAAGVALPFDVVSAMAVLTATAVQHANAMQRDDPVQMSADGLNELFSTDKVRIVDRKTGDAPHFAQPLRGQPPATRSYSAEDVARWGRQMSSAPIVGYVDEPAAGASVTRVYLVGKIAYGLVEDLLRRRG